MAKIAHFDLVCTKHRRALISRSTIYKQLQTSTATNKNKLTTGIGSGS